MAAEDLGDKDRCEDALTHQAFYEKALAAAADWTRFADPKALGVLIFLSLGVADLINTANDLTHAHRHDSLAGCLATGAFWLACGLAVLVVFFVARAIFPRLKPNADQRGQDSVFYFASIAKLSSPAEFRIAVERRSSAELREDIANQVWEVARIADAKHRAARTAFYVVLGFLAVWAVARIALSFAA